MKTKSEKLVFKTNIFLCSKLLHLLPLPFWNIHTNKVFW